MPETLSAWLTRETFDLMIYAVIAVGGLWAALRLWHDFTRPLPPPTRPTDDTLPHQERR